MTFNQYKVNYTGLHKRPTYEGLINYLANEQELIQYPNRAATQARKHPYLTQLDVDDYDQMTEQQLNILKAKMIEDKLNEQAGGPGGPGVNVLRAMATGTSSSSSSGSGSYASIGSYKSSTGRPSFLPPSGGAPFGTPSRGSVVARPSVYAMSAASSSSGSAANDDHLQDAETLMRAQNAEAAQIEKQYEEEKQQKQAGMKQMAHAAVSNIFETSTDRVMRMQQEQETKKQKQQQREVSEERRKQQQTVGGSVARAFSPAHQGSTIQARGRSPSVRTLFDDPGTGGSSSSQVRATSASRIRSSGGQTATGVGELPTIAEGAEDFSKDKKMKGTDEVKIDNFYKYWQNKGMTLENLKKQFEMRKLTPKPNTPIIELIAELITYDRKKRGMQGIASVQEIQPGGKAQTRSVIQILYPSP
jgi:hypothetical protein